MIVTITLYQLDPALDLASWPKKLTFLRSLLGYPWELVKSGEGLNNKATQQEVVCCIKHLSLPHNMQHNKVLGSRYMRYMNV